MRRSKDPELLKAVADAHQAAKESSRYADEAASQADELEEKLGALATSLEVHVMNKLEGSFAPSATCPRRSTRRRRSPKEHSGPRVAVNTNLVDERIDKRFEDMEQMLDRRGTRDAPRGSRKSRRFAARPTTRTRTRTNVSRSSEACAKGWNGGDEGDRDGEGTAAEEVAVVQGEGGAGHDGREKEKAALEKRRLEELKGAIRSGQFPPVTQQHHM